MGSSQKNFLMMTFALLGPCQILWRAIWQGKSESDIHGTYFFKKFQKFQKSAKKLSEWTLEILAPTVTYFKKNTSGAIIHKNSLSNFNNTVTH